MAHYLPRGKTAAICTFILVLLLADAAHAQAAFMTARGRKYYHGSAKTQPRYSGFYAKFAGGASAPEKLKDVNSVEVKAKGSAVTRAALGYAWRNGFSIDAGMEHRDGYSASFTPADVVMPNNSLVGAVFPYSMQSKAVTVNVSYYFLRSAAKVYPFVGITAGTTFNRIPAFDATFTQTFTAPPAAASNPTPGSYHYENGKWESALSWSAIAGLHLRLHDNVGFEVTYGYTSLGKFNSSKRGTATMLQYTGGNYALTTASTDNLDQVGTQANVHEITAGLRCFF